MQCYTELLPPSAVTHSISLPFISASANNLIIARTSLLQIYTLKSVITHTESINLSDGTTKSNGVKHESVNGPESSVPGSAILRGERLHTTRLVLLAQYELSGIVTSVARVKILQSKSGGEALLVVLKDAKLSLVEWDPERFSISTISIHYYEREDIINNPWDPDMGQCVNILTVDPSSRCAVFKFGTRHIAILPFHQIGDDLVMDDVDDDYDPDIDGERPERKSSTAKDIAGTMVEKPPYAASFVLSLMALDPSLSHPIHLSFLYEYREPTFGVLYSELQSSSGLLHERRDNVSYAVYTLDLDQRASTTLLSVTNLPYDLTTIIPLSRPMGGALLLGSNEIIHVDQSGKSNGVFVNDIAKQSTSFGMVDQSDLKMRLEHCIIKELGLSNSELLIILNRGELAILSFKIDGRSVSGLSIRRVTTENGGNTILAGASCAALVGRGRLFVGSEESDSLVLGWSRKSDRSKKQLSRRKSDMDVDDDNDNLDLDEEDVEADEDDLYTDDAVADRAQIAASGSSTDHEDYVFRSHDILINLAPMSDIAVDNPAVDRRHPDFADRTRSMLNLMTISGRGRAGSLTKLQEEIVPQEVDQSVIKHARCIWSIRTKQTARNATVESHGAAHHSYIVATVAADGEEERPTVYRIQDMNLQEIEETEILDADAGDTIEVDTLNGATVTAQVTQTQVRVYDSGESANIFFFHLCSYLACHYVVFSACQEATGESSLYEKRVYYIGAHTSKEVVIAGCTLIQTCSVASIQFYFHHLLAMNHAICASTSRLDAPFHMHPLMLIQLLTHIRLRSCADISPDRRR